jgi:hypothetical protein
MSTLPTKTVLGGNLAQSQGSAFLSLYGQLPQLALGFRFFMEGSFQVMDIGEQILDTGAAVKRPRTNSTSA